MKNYRKIQKHLLQSKKSYLNSIGYIFGMVSCGFLAWFIYSRFKSSNQEILIQVFSGLFLFFSLLCFFLLVKQRNIKCYESHFLVEDFFGLRNKTFQYQDIKYWVCEEVQGRYTSWTQFVLWFNDDTKIKIHKSDYTNFSELFLQITNGKPENETLKTKREHKHNLIRILLFLILITVSFYKIYKALTQI